MRKRPKALDRAFQFLKIQAQSEGKKLDQSFYVELENYSRHLKVEDLPDDELKKVIEGLGGAAMEEGGDKVGGGAVRNVILRKCTESFGDCSEAARSVLS